ncbi:putative peptidase m16 inactive domain-containing protein [Botrytis fragariae]|uniref:Putative peptidase m16 inactive domain-containing protein n=1 Tax=Botrytis fragariae TaxID=1964551 RepID=A0A8H6EL39_9HELO|nr:putative peptidase m16 inactive domain-containing protein [Botrytis fragariae]KAF5876257.1 putative peptidase m16 inactive domain-containing protein [Botrytis fragariae]
MGEALHSGSVEHLSDKMEKPLLDDRLYRVIHLPNHLEILLIHDPDTDKAAAAMDVNFGSFSDPHDLPGTAHAVEHFCFMGTKKYPGENEYSTYLTKYGGNSNAYTASTSTNYYFELSASSTSNFSGSSATVKQSNVPIAKDKAPLYGALDRFSQFFIQPLFLADTLDRELRAVDSEYKKNLQSDAWRLMQLSRSTSSDKHPMNNFAAGNYQCLREIPVSRGVNVRKRFIEFYKAYYSANRMKLVVLGREPLQELESWVQELFSNVPNKNLHRLRWGGIPVLDEPELMTQIFVKPVMELRLLNINFTYPDEEDLFASHPSRYLEHLIGHESPGSAIAYLKELESPPLTWISDEMNRLAEVEFKFRQKLPPSRTVSGLAQLMQKACIPREHLLSPSLIRKFDPENIERGLSHLRPDNFRFFVVDQQFPGDWNATEKWYETEYKLEKIPEGFKQELWAAVRAPVTERPSKVHLPAVNEFVPQRLEVERKDVTDPARHPTLIRHDDSVRVWFKKDDQFWAPKANIELFLRSPVASVTPMNTIMTQITGLNYSISESAQGLNIEIDGFNDKMSVLLEEPYRQINAFSRMLISERSWAPFEMLEELPAVTAEDLRSYSPELLRQMYIEILVHGNLHREDALSIAKLVESTLRPHRLPEAQWPPRRAIALPSGVNYLYERVLKNPDNVNHCLEYIISVGSISDRVQRAKLLLFAQIANEPCFNTLRTKEQLGYIVNSDASVYATVGTWCIIVQSERNCKYLEERCDAFLVKLEQDLRAMTDETFEEHKIGLINKRLEKLKNLGQEALRFWNHITSEVFDFEQAAEDRAAAENNTNASTFNAEQEIMAVNEHEASVSSVKIPVKIEDFKAWKASLCLSAAATPVKSLSEFDDFGSTL